MYLAHVTGNDPQRKQELKEHCEKTAQYALERVNKDSFDHTIRLAGWLHDLGKYSDDFQAYISNSLTDPDVKKRRVIHTFTGVIYILEKCHNEYNTKYEKRTSELIAYAIGAHHGMFDSINYKEENEFERRLKYSKDSLQYEIVMKRFYEQHLSEQQVEREFQMAVVEIKDFTEKVIEISRNWQQSESKHSQYNCVVELRYMWGMLIRMITSAVMYGDRTDTAEFMQDISHKDKTVTASFWKEQCRFMERKLYNKLKLADDTSINRERQRISEACKAFAKKGNGIYKLSVPTGAGKTLSTIRYAYSLAELEKKQKVIFVIPLLSVLEQNADEIKKYTKAKECVGEHHSNIVQEDDTYEQHKNNIQEKDTSESLKQSQLLAEFWDEPIIITTLYQLLMNLFSEKTTYVTRYSALANSVIVIDEAQSIPFRDIYMFDLAINFLNGFFNTTIILCSATQPAFENAAYPIRFTKPVQMVGKSEERSRVFKRVNVKNMVTPHGMSNEEITEYCMDLMEEIQSLLIICNTKKQASSLYRKMEYYKNDKLVIFHLSTSMCLQHRRDTLLEINECLQAKKGKKIICISTQLVEAGIDFSFESVVRSLAGIDNIIQAFGRCNRNFENEKIMNAYIIKMREEDLTNLKDIKEAQNSTQSLLEAYSNNPEKFDNDILSDKSIQYYYEVLFSFYEKNHGLDYNITLMEEQIKDSIFNLLSLNCKIKNDANYFTHQAFLTAGRYFQVFDSETVDVITPYKRGADIIIELGSSKALYDIKYQKSLLKEAGNFSVQIWKNQLQKLIDDGIIIPILGEIDYQILYYELSDQNYTDIGFDAENCFV